MSDPQVNVSAAETTPLFRASDRAFSLFRQYRLLQSLRERSDIETKEFSRMLKRNEAFSENITINGKNYWIVLEDCFNYKELKVYPCDGPSPD